MLSAGDRLGPYEIETPVGAGGMGEVYRAKDTRLDRTVAVKVLPARSALNNEARSRFEREAKTISSLNHPHICTLHDVGRTGEIDYIVMEFLEGETLDDRLKKGRMNSDEALAIGAQIAGALDAAHRKGLVHRDLKPGNVFLTRDGAKLLDFGLAKLQAEAIAGMADETRTTPVTGAGTIVGTLQYMSPEQLEGREADARSDIFAFGATLYEMVSGQRAFSGNSKASLIGSIMKEEPRAISEIHPTSPPALDRLIRKCLKKDPAARWQSARDLKDELEWIASAGSQAGIPRPLASMRRFQLRLSWVVTAVCATAALYFAFQYFGFTEPEARVINFAVARPAELRTVDWPQISPDGKYLAFRGTGHDRQTGIWIRPLDSKEAFFLAGTENVWRHFWSPDSKFLAFFDASRETLRKISISGGPPQLICRVKGTDGSWGSNGIILFDEFDGGTAIGQVSAAGGEARTALRPDSTAGEYSVAWPDFLPDGRHFIYAAYGPAGFSPTSPDVQIKIGSLDDTESKFICQSESQAFYCEPGYLVFSRNGCLVVQRFNTETLELEGDAIPISDSIGTSVGDPTLNASASNDGILVWQGIRTPVRHLVWLDRNGNEVGRVGAPDDYVNVALSPDNTKAAVEVGEAGTPYQHIHILEFDRPGLRRLTRDGIVEYEARWSRDGSAIAYSGRRSESATSESTYVCTLTDLRSSLLCGTDSAGVFALAWPSENKILCQRVPWQSSWPVITNRSEILEIDSREPGNEQVIGTLPPTLTYCVDVSPDLKYVLTEGYYAPDSGVYVNDMSNLERRWQLSRTGAKSCWSPKGDEIFFWEGLDFYGVKVDTRNGFTSSTPLKLFSREPTAISYDVSRDGQRFLCAFRDFDQEKSEDFEVIVNWTELLESR